MARRFAQRSGSLAVIGAILASLVAGAACAAPAWRADVVVDNTAGASPLVEHQVAVTLDGAALVAAGRLRADAADLRFTDALGTPLCHSVESGLGTAATVVWVKVPSIPAHGSAILGLTLGDPTAPSVDDPVCTFPFYDGFDGASSHLTALCGDVARTVADGTLALAWSGSGLVVSDVVFPLSQVHVAEARVLSTTGAWPGLYWMKSGSQVSYGVVSGPDQVRIGRSAYSGGNACAGHDWASTPQTPAGTAGTWQLVWSATGSVAASVPDVGTLTTIDTSWARDEHLRLALGGVASGSGTMLLDWVRTRRYTPTPPVTSMTNLRHVCTDAPASCDDGDACTTDACAPSVGCTHAARACDDGDVCTTDACDVARGCTVTPITCNDGDACTTDACDPDVGCTVATLGCDDGDACTDDACDAGSGCGHVPIRGATFHAVRCGLDALYASVDEPRGREPPAVVVKLLAKASSLVTRATELAGGGRHPQAARRLRQAGVVLGRLAARLRRLAERGKVDATDAAAWATEADALVAAVTELRTAPATTP